MRTSHRDNAWICHGVPRLEELMHLCRVYTYIYITPTYACVYIHVQKDTLRRSSDRIGTLQRRTTHKSRGAHVRVHMYVYVTACVSIIYFVLVDFPDLPHVHVSSTCLDGELNIGTGSLCMHARMSTHTGARLYTYRYTRICACTCTH